LRRQRYAKPADRLSLKANAVTNFYLQSGMRLTAFGLGRTVTGFMGTPQMELPHEAYRLAGIMLQPLGEPDRL
jgi:hypothetical protein